MSEFAAFARGSICSTFLDSVPLMEIARPTSTVGMALSVLMNRRKEWEDTFVKIFGVPVDGEVGLPKKIGALYAVRPRCGRSGLRHPPPLGPSARHSTPALLYHPPPVTVHYYACDFCEAHVDSPWSHITHACPVFLLRVQWAFVRLLATLPKQVGSYLANGTTLVQPSSAMAIAVVLETDHQVPKPLSPLHMTVYTPSGLFSRPEEIRTPRPSARDHVRLILETMADHSRTLVDPLLVLDTLEWPTRPTPSLNPHVHVLAAKKVLPLSVAFLARWTTCHLQSWRMVAGGLLPMRMPPPPPTHLLLGPRSDLCGATQRPRALDGSLCPIPPEPPDRSDLHPQRARCASAGGEGHGYTSRARPCTAVECCGRPHTTTT